MCHIHSLPILSEANSLQRTVLCRVKKEKRQYCFTLCYPEMAELWGVAGEGME